MNGGPSDQEFELYTTALDQYHLSRDLYWKRVSTFLGIQGFLFAALSLTGEYPSIGVIIGVFGFLFSIIWHTVMHHSEANVVSRRATVALLEDDIDLTYPLLNMAIAFPGPEETRLVTWMRRLKHDPELYAPTLTATLWLASILYFGLVLSEFRLFG